MVYLRGDYVSVQHTGKFLHDATLFSVNPVVSHEEAFKKNLMASKPSEHPPQVEECLKV